MSEQMKPDSEGAWICKRHEVERGHDKYGSYCFRCLKEKHEQLQSQLASTETENKRLAQVCIKHGFEINKLIEELDDEKEKGRWIPVAERLPKPDENTHPQQSVKVRLAKIIEVDAWYEECDKHWHDARTGSVITGTHWRPLPKGT